MADFEPQWLKFVSTGWTARQIGMLLPWTEVRDGVDLFRV